MIFTDLQVISDISNRFRDASQMGLRDGRLILPHGFCIGIERGENFSIMVLPGKSAFQETPRIRANKTSWRSVTGQR